MRVPLCFAEDPASVILIQIQILLKIHLHAEPGGIRCISGQTEHRPGIAAGEDFRSVRPARRAEETRAVLEMIGERADPRIECFDRDEIMAFFQIRLLPAGPERKHTR